MTYGEVQDTEPGIVLDLYIYRRNYDDMENGLTRE